MKSPLDTKIPTIAQYAKRVPKKGLLDPSLVKGWGKVKKVKLKF